MLVFTNLGLQQEKQQGGLRCACTPEYVHELSLEGRGGEREREQHVPAALLTSPLPVNVPE